MATTSWKTKNFGGFSSRTREITSNCTGIEPVDISTEDFYFSRPCKIIQVGSAGVVKLIMFDDSIATVQAGDNEMIPYGIYQGVQREGTSASNITGWVQGV